MNMGDRLRKSGEWMLDSPEALVILMLMASGMSGVFFTMLIMAMLIAKNWFFMVLFAFLGYGAIYQFVKIYRLYKLVGLKNVLGGITAREFVWHKGGNNNGNNGCKSDEVCYKPDEEKDGRIGKEVRCVYLQPERSSQDGSNELSDAEDDSQKD